MRISLKSFIFFTITLCCLFFYSITKAKSPADNNLTSVLVEMWDNGAWINSNLTSYTYSGDLLQSIIYQGWSEGAWANLNKSVYTYDANGYTATMMYQLWNGSAWENIYELLFTVDVQGNTTEIIQQSLIEGQWVKSSKTVYTYQDGKVMTTTFYSWLAPDWVSYYRITNTYSGGNLISSLGESYSNGTWQTTGKDTYTYDASNNNTQHLFSLWINESGTWLDVHRTTYNYDASGNDIYGLFENNYSGAWENNGRYNSTFNSDNLISVKISEDWVDGAWVNSERETYQYNGTSDVNSDRETISTGYTLSQNYPNPFNPSTRIRFNLPESNRVTIKIFDSLGKEVKELFNNELPAGTHEVEFVADKLSSGTYFYRIQTIKLSPAAGKSFIQTGKMILVK